MRLKSSAVFSGATGEVIKEDVLYLVRVPPQEDETFVGQLFAACHHLLTLMAEDKAESVALSCAVNAQPHVVRRIMEAAWLGATETAHLCLGTKAGHQPCWLRWSSHYPQATGGAGAYRQDSRDTEDEGRRPPH